MRGKQLTALQIAERGNVLRYDLEKQVWLADWRAMGLPYCSIYVVSTTDGWPCKIGISVNPMKRVSALQISCWKPLEVAWCGFLATVQNAKALERKAHQSLTEQSLWLHGEWFDLRPGAARDLIKFEADLMGLELHDTLPDGAALDFVEERYTAKTMTPTGHMHQIKAHGKF